MTTSVADSPGIDCAPPWLRTLLELESFRILTRRRVGRGELVGLLAVIGLAAWLRLGYPGVNSFAFDEARLSLIALEMARGGEFATVGMPSSARVPNMPAAAWLFAIPYSLSPDPMVATNMIALASLAAVVGVWWLARQWHPHAGLMAALLLAAHPYAVLYGRSIWAQNLLIPLTVLWLVAAHCAVIQKRFVWVGTTAFLTGFILQVHFAGAALVLAGGYVFLRFRWWRYPAAVITGGVLAALCAAPFILTPGAVTGLMGAAGGEAQIDLLAASIVPRLVVGVGWQYLLPGEVELPLVRVDAAIFNAGLSVVLVIFIGLMGVFGAASLFGVRVPAEDVETAKPNPHDRQPVPYLVELALVVLAAPLIFFTRHSTPIFIHYLLPVLPAVAVMVGWFVASRQRWLRLGTLIGVGILTLGWVGQLIRAFPVAAQQHTPNGMATPLGVLRDAAQVPASTRPMLYFTHGDNPDVDGEPAIFRALWWPRRDNTRIIDGRSVLILPPYAATMMFTERPFQAWEEMRESELLIDPADVPRRDGVEPFQVIPYDGETMPAGFMMLAQPVTFDHGGTLLGWRTYTVGPRARISTLWRSSGPIGQAVQQFHHLRTDSTPTGEPHRGSDVSVRGHLWQADDLVIVMGDFLDLSPGVAYTVEVGHYTLPDVQRISSDAGDVIRLGTVQFTFEP